MVSRAEVTAALTTLGVPDGFERVEIRPDSIHITTYVRGIGGHVLDDPNDPESLWRVTATVPIVDEPDAVDQYLEQFAENVAPGRVQTDADVKAPQ